jgi:nitrogen fixation protein
MNDRKVINLEEGWEFMQARLPRYPADTRFPSTRIAPALVSS